MNNKSIFIPIAVVAAMIAIAAGAIRFYFDSYYERNGIKLVKMPGTQVIELESREYWIWFVNKWKSRGINGSREIVFEYDLFDLKPLDSKSPVVLRPAEHDFVTGHEDRMATLVLKASVSKSGKYRVTFKKENIKPFIVVIAPREVHAYDLGSTMSFDGM